MIWPVLKLKTKSLRVRLGQCCVEVHYGIVLGDEFWPQFLAQPRNSQLKK